MAALPPAPASSAVRSTLLVSAGSVLGQGVIIAATPLITRLYTPSEMGIYAVFVALIGIFSVPIALHYELAVPLPRRDSEAARIALLGSLVACITSIALGVGIFLLRKPLLSLTNTPELEGVIWLVPVALVLSGIVNVLTTWVIRKKHFRASAAAQVAQGLGQSVPQVTAGLLHAGVGGLIAGQIIGLVSAVVALASGGVPSVRRRSRRSLVRGISTVAKRYRKFAQITVWSSLANALASQIPVMLLASLFGAFVAGQFALSFRLLQIPLRLIGQAISQVFFSHAAVASRSGSVADLTSRIFRGLFAFGLPSFALSACIAPQFFRFAFGVQWVDGGYYTQLLTPWIFLSFISSVLSVLVSVLQKQSAELVLQAAYLVVVVFSLGLGYLYDSPWVAMTALGFLGGAYFFGKICWLVTISGGRVSSDLWFCLREVFITAPVAALLIWLASGVANDVAVIGVGVVSMLVVHFWNYRVRGVYAFTGATMGEQDK